MRKQLGKNTCSYCYSGAFATYFYYRKRFSVSWHFSILFYCCSERCYKLYMDIAKWLVRFIYKYFYYSYYRNCRWNHYRECKQWLRKQHYTHTCCYYEFGCACSTGNYCRKYFRMPIIFSNIFCNCSERCNKLYMDFT